MKQKSIAYQFVEYIPEALDEDVLYISKKYKTAVHKCFCGCGEEVVTPLSQVDWSIKIKNNKVTMYPSIGNWSYVCRSHYWIRNSAVVWAGEMSEERVQAGREQERRLRELYFREINKENIVLVEKDVAIKKSGIFSTIYTKLKKWLSS